MHKHRTSIIWA